MAIGWENFIVPHFKICVYFAQIVIRERIRAQFSRNHFGQFFFPFIRLEINKINVSSSERANCERFHRKFENQFASNNENVKFISI